MSEKPDYIEWEAEGGAPEQRKSGHSRVETLFDAEARRRVGQLIARASEDAGKRKK